jgi:hypothetical protein
MRTEIYTRQPDGTTRLAEITELLRDAYGKPRYRREKPPGTVVEDRDATLAEAQALADDERMTRREEARVRAMAAIKANAGQTPWGQILKDLAVAQGWMEPES